MYSTASWVRILQFIPLVLFIRKGNKNMAVPSFLPILLLKHNKVAKQPIPSVFILVFHFI